VLIGKPIWPTQLNIISHSVLWKTNYNVLFSVAINVVNTPSYIIGAVSVAINVVSTPSYIIGAVSVAIK
jgi:hypothetical protein